MRRGASAWRRVLSLIVLSFSVGCGTFVATAGVPLTGAWGGVHLQAQLTDSGGTLEYDCASGTISGPLVPDERGHVSAVGIHSPGHGGPTMQGEVPPKLPARYDGLVSGDRLALVVTLTESNLVVGSFDLRRGAPGQVFRCL